MPQLDMEWFDRANNEISTLRALSGDEQVTHLLRISDTDIVLAMLLVTASWYYLDPVARRWFDASSRKLGGRGLAQLLADRQEVSDRLAGAVPQ